jgi:homoserine kinase type II
MDLDAASALLPRWGFPLHTAIAPVRAPGTNNQTFLVRHRRQRYVLQISRVLSAAEVRAEHRILRWLRQGRLPLQVPDPVTARDGQTVMETAAGPATVCRWLPGVTPTLDGPPAFGRYGRAAGQLSAALAEVPLDAALRDWRTDPLWIWPDGLPVGVLCGELRTAGMSTAQADLIEAAARRVGQWWPAAADLRVQVIHGDLAPSNMLAGQQTGEVTGLLDFEFAGAGFRVQELLAALYNSPALDGPHWPRSVAAVVRGWVSVCGLEAAFSEVTARAQRLETITRAAASGGAFVSVVAVAACS